MEKQVNLKRLKVIHPIHKVEGDAFHTYPNLFSSCLYPLEYPQAQGSRRNNNKNKSNTLVLLKSVSIHALSFLNSDSQSMPFLCAAPESFWLGLCSRCKERARTLCIVRSLVTVPTRPSMYGHFGKRLMRSRAAV